MRRGTKIQKLKQALPGIVKDVRHYAMKGLEITIRKGTVL